MKKDTIVQFVCFTTNLGSEEFAVKWDHYVKQFTNGYSYMMLQEAEKAKNKYKYVSQHECRVEDFRFAFMKGRSSEHFPEHTAKVIQIGGYTPLQVQCPPDEQGDDVKVIAFIGHNETDLDFYHQLSYHHLNIYEAYFENCTYAYVMEFFINANDAPILLEQLKTRTSAEAALYKECAVLHF